MAIVLAGPTENDGRPVFVVSPSTTGWMTWFTGAGDDPAPTPPAKGRGTGTKLRLSFTGAEVKTVDLVFSEPVELHDGEMFYTGTWELDDCFDFSAVIPATTVTPNAGAGNCNLVDAGGYNVIVPAAGDGSHDVDLSSPMPVVPALGGGYWEADQATALVTPSSTPGQSDWHLLDVPVESFFLRQMPMGHPLGKFEIDAYKAEWVSPAWSLRLRVDKQSAGAGEVAGWLMLFREKST